MRVGNDDMNDRSGWVLCVCGKLVGRSGRVGSGIVVFCRSTRPSEEEDSSANSAHSTSSANSTKASSPSDSALARDSSAFVRRISSYVLASFTSSVARRCRARRGRALEVWALSGRRLDSSSPRAFAIAANLLRLHHRIPHPLLLLQNHLLVHLSTPHRDLHLFLLGSSQGIGRPTLATSTTPGTPRTQHPRSPYSSTEDFQTIKIVLKRF